jgi:acyl carrier protein
LGADSLDLVTIANRMERDLGFRPSITEMYYEPAIVNLIDSYHKHTT